MTRFQSTGVTGSTGLFSVAVLAAALSGPVVAGLGARRAGEVAFSLGVAKPGGLAQALCGDSRFSQGVAHRRANRGDPRHVAQGPERAHRQGSSRRALSVRRKGWGNLTADDGEWPCEVFEAPRFERSLP